MMKAVILDADTLHPADIDLAALQALPLLWQTFPVTTPEQLDARLAGVDVVLTNKVRLEAAHFERHPNLKLVVVLATGTNNIDLAAARAAGVDVCNVVGYSTPSVVQQTFALMLALCTRLRELDQSVRAGDWARSPHFCVLDYPSWELAGKTLGVVGYGRLGQGVAEVGRVFGMQVLVAESLSGGDGMGRVPLAHLLRESDVVSLHCPLSEQTRGLIGAEALALMKPTALLINTARGGVVDELALLEALRAGHLRGAALDVLAQEPPQADHPLLTANLSNVIVTPHVAWASQEARQRLVQQAAEVITSWMAGQCMNRVN